MSQAVIDLATNRNPLGPAGSVRKRLSQAQGDRKGSRPEEDSLRALLGDLHGLPGERILLDHGSEAILARAAREVFSSGGSWLHPRFSHEGAVRTARVAGARLVESPASPEEVDAEGLLRSVQPDTRLVYLANVNNPTGVRVDGEALASLVRRLREDILLVVDQAYAEYDAPGGFPDAASLLIERKRLLVLHTFSKLHGFALHRMGYGLGTPWVAERLGAPRRPSGLDPLGVLAAEAAVQDRAFVESSRQRNAEARSGFLEEAGRHRCRASGDGGNFVLLETMFPAEELAKDLLRRGFAVRPLQDFGLGQHVRITLGTPEQMEAFWRVASPLLDGCGCSRSL